MRALRFLIGRGAAGGIFAADAFDCPRHRGRTLAGAPEPEPHRVGASGIVLAEHRVPFREHETLGKNNRLFGGAPAGLREVLVLPIELEQ